MVGGGEEDFERARPLFDAMGKTVVHVGDPGAGQIVKASNQIVVALVIEAVSEALVLSSKAGVDPAKVVEVLSGGLAANKVMEVKRDRLLNREFEPGGKVESHHKDLGIALESGREYGVALPGTALVHEMFGALIAKGGAAGTTPPLSRSSRSGLVASFLAGRESRKLHDSRRSRVWPGSRSVFRIERSRTRRRFVVRLPLLSKRLTS
jgi:3-hydroxyisobutyrate dehydrogenase-like beta-hydroxyacid dehydrogenase